MKMKLNYHFKKLISSFKYVFYFRTKFIIIFLKVFFIVFLIGCQTYFPEPFEKVLKQAGKNRKQLQKVFSYYKNPKDSLKLKAACFLIENMPDKYGLYYPEDAYYFNILEKVDSLKKIDATEDKINTFIDGWLKTMNPLNESDVELKKNKDIEIIKADYLIENIDLAFVAWQKPWAKHLSFEDFCEWLLPYRINTEPLQNWRKYMYEKLSWIDDSMKNSTDTKKACLLVNNFIANDFQFSHKLGFIPYLGGIDAWNYKSGLCEHRYALIVMAMRSVGIPVAIDYTKQFPRKVGAHLWTVLLDSGNITKSFNGGEKKISIFYPNISPIGVDEQVCNVYRYLYEKNIQALPLFLPVGDIPLSFRNIYEKEVTHEYEGLRKADITYSFSEKTNEEYAFLFSFNYGTQLNAVSYAKVADNKVVFKNIGRNGIYITGFYRNDKVIPASLPFILPNYSGYIEFINPDLTKKQKVRLYRKFTVKYTMVPFVKAMIGAKIQGANKPDFSDAFTLNEIKTEVNYFKEILINSKDNYLFYRYLSSDSGDIRIADIVLFTKDENTNKKIINGNVFGFISDNNTQDDTLFINAFDNNIRTNFNAPKGSWVALDAGTPVKLTSFKIMARNHLNIVEPGDTYELLYFDYGWYSLGKKVAEDHFVDFDNVPKGAILLLKNLTKGQEERIFMYENGDQVWW